MKTRRMIISFVLCVVSLLPSTQLFASPRAIGAPLYRNASS